MRLNALYHSTRQPRNNAVQFQRQQLRGEFGSAHAPVRQDGVDVHGVKAEDVEQGTRYKHRLHRAPTDAEVAAELDMSIEDFQDSLTRISNSSVIALDELWTLSDSSGDQVSLLDTIQDPDAVDPAHAMDATETKDRLADAIARLPEREKLVVALYYYENLTLREIGEVLGVTESRVSQLHTKAVLRLKSALQSELLD